MSGYGATAVRLRLIHAVRDRRPFTTTTFCDRLLDVSKATMYRQVVLADAGILEIEGEERVRGAVEGTYRLQAARTPLDPEAPIAEQGPRLRRSRWGLWTVVAILVIGLWIFNEFVAPIFGYPSSTIRVREARSSPPSTGNV